MERVAPVPFEVFVSDSVRFREVAPQWSFAHGSHGSQKGLMAVRASYEDEDGVPLVIESALLGRLSREHVSPLPLRFAIARSRLKRDDLDTIMRRTAAAKNQTFETSLQVKLGKRLLTGPALSYEQYLAGSVCIDDQRITVSGVGLAMPVAIRPHEGPLHYRLLTGA